MKSLIAAVGVLAIMAVQPASASVDRSSDTNSIVATKSAASSAPLSGQPVRMAGRMVTSGP